jgi:flagellar motor protein MotB
MDDDQGLSFNFWPAFTDLMLCLILILLLVIGGTHFSSINIRSIQETQQQIGEALLRSEKRTSKKLNGGDEIYDQNGRFLYRLAADPHDPMLQIISFSDSLLFNSDDYRLKPSGQEALRDIGGVLRGYLEKIAEIQIRGHADTHPTLKYEDNLDLASRRANAVFRFLTQDIRIDPSQIFLSATSFGEYFPVQRGRNSSFNQEQLEEANSTDSFRQANRRIEMVLFFRRPRAVHISVASQNN